MSQQYEYHLPPPPPPRPPPLPEPRHGSTSPAVAGLYLNSSASASVAEQASHGIQFNRSVSSTQLPSITTTALSRQAPTSSQLSTPVSSTYLSPAGSSSYAALSSVNPRTPVGLVPPSPIAQSPRSPAMEPYNPRQWSSRGQVSTSQRVFQQRPTSSVPSSSQVTGMEAAMPSPPPPYSPGTPDQSIRASVVSMASVASPLSENFTVSSPPDSSSARASPKVPMSPAFPPPPSQGPKHRDRSASGIAGNKSFFSLSGLRGKQPVSIDTQLPQASSSAHLSFIDVRPPAAKRAASTGHIQSETSVAASPAASFGRASPEAGWQPGMPLPGPPPGPPPAGMRSQSLNSRVGAAGSGSATPEHLLDAPRPRRIPAAAKPTLDSVPPTPANWNDADAQISSEEQRFREEMALTGDDFPVLRIDTGSKRDSMLARRPAKRDSNSTGIRERRSKSRAAKGSNDDDSRPSNLVFSPDDGSISRRREHKRTVSGYIEPSSAPSPSYSSAANSGNGTTIVPTPPYTPAVGKQPLGSGRKLTDNIPGSASSDRPTSQLHTPREDAAMPAPLGAGRPPSRGHPKPSSSLTAFSAEAIERHRSFIEKEASATTDQERLELFTNFMVHESRLRRDRYAAAYNAMAGDILDLTRDMWRSYSARNSRRAATPSTSMSSFDPTVPAWASDGQPGSAANMPSSASSTGDFTPATDAASVGETADAFDRADARQWADSFKPSLSPIPSMAFSTAPDESSSRGRTPSRWWEASNSGGNSIGNPERLEKSKRETKYMGVNPAVLQASSVHSTRPPLSHTESDQLPAYGPNEYPPEKVGWHEESEYDTPMVTPRTRSGEVVSIPGAEPLDVSRLVTLPPANPRHHPAVNNSHPQLAHTRSEHRLLADHSDILKIRDSYLDHDFALSREQSEAMKQRRAKLRADIQERIAAGTMSFAEAAKVEADFDIEEAERGKATARANFDVFEASVSHPLNTLLIERLDRANACIKELKTELESGHQAANPNQAQEEGDEHPERLEKLTLLKWIFETREQLHKEMFELHAMRSEKYSEVILTPYRISKAQAKIDEATLFFKKDSTERQLTYAKDYLKRLEELQAVMEQNVTRGVEDQLSAFWDIVPGLVEVLQNIPSQMQGLEVRIPPQEYDENPSYHEHPLQYLFSLLSHAEKSTYQFIESQINLLCLLHEVRTATTKSRLRLVEIERNAASPNDPHIHAEMTQAKREAENHLTEDLKERVRDVERQWQEALGDGMAACKTRVKGWLEESGGSEDGLEGWR